MRLFSALFFGIGLACSREPAQPAAIDSTDHAAATAIQNSVALDPVALEKNKSAPVVVTIVVDQLAAWVAQERWPQLPADGFRRLIAQGTWVTQMRYQHSLNETAPGHASLYTGAIPHDHKIAANIVYRYDLGREASLLIDPKAKLIGPAGPLRGDAPSLAALHRSTLADRLREHDPQAVIVSLSVKDRGAIFGGGRKPDATLWYDEKRGGMVSSTALISAIPSWALPYGQPLQRFQHAVWQPLDADFLARNVGVVDDFAGERSLLGDRSFPHDLSRSSQPAGDLRYLPFLDEWLVDLASAALKQARKPDHSMLLALSFSANDYIGHAFGPDSWEAWDGLLRLDRQLARLFKVLDDELGSHGYAVILAADHGIGVLPERLTHASTLAWCQPGAANPFAKPCTSLPRLVGHKLEDQVRVAMRRKGWKNKASIAAIVDSLVFFDEAARNLPTEQRRAFEKDVIELLHTHRSIAEVVRPADVAELCHSPSAPEAWALVCRSLPADLVDLLILGKSGVSFTDDVDSGLGHGAAFAYDRVVPLLVRYSSAKGPKVIESADFATFAASAWYALSGERNPSPYGMVVGD